MRLLCIGSDQSSALSNSSAPGAISPLQAVRAAFSETSSIGGVVTVSIRDVPQPLGHSKKPAFPLFYGNGSRDTLDQLTTWGGSGKDNWVLTGMIETVSTSRILPPVSFYTVGQRKRSGRSSHYKLRLTAYEKQELKTSLAHSVGITDYPQVKASFLDAKEQFAAVREMTADLAAALAKNAALEALVSELRKVEEVAKDWAKGMGDNSLADRVDDLRKLYAEMKREAPVFVAGG